MKICCCCCDKAKVDADVDTDARSEPLLAGKKSKNEVTFEEVAKITLESTQDEPKNVKMIRAYSRKGSVADMSIDSNDSSLSDLPDGIPSELEQEIRFGGGYSNPVKYFGQTGKFEWPDWSCF